MCRRPTPPGIALCCCVTVNSLDLSDTFYVFVDNMRSAASCPGTLNPPDYQRRKKMRPVNISKTTTPRATFDITENVLRRY